LLRANTGAAERLIIEITETAAIQDVDDARSFVSRVKDLGCRSHRRFRRWLHVIPCNLRKLGVDIMKIDGAFTVQNIMKSDDDRAFVQTLIDLARRLGLKTVAEWVQDEEAARLLADLGCDFLQGSLIGLASDMRPWMDAKSTATA
jgi:EAL domain-containing protein (putative c-di-GMP-specific phosphodiesterase class I)